LVIQGETETLILEYAEQRPGLIESAIAKPGFITAPGRDPPPVPGLPNLRVQDLAAALLDQVVNGFEKDTFFSDDMTRLGQRVLPKK